VAAPVLGAIGAKNSAEEHALGRSREGFSTKVHVLGAPLDRILFRQDEARPPRVFRYEKLARNDLSMLPFVGNLMG